MRTILGHGGKVRARIQETPTIKTLLTAGGQVIGTYRKDLDQTFKVGGYFYSYGDCLMELLED